MLDETCQVFHVNRRQVVVATVDHGKRSKVWVQGEPSPSEELIENVVCLTMAVWQPAAKNAHFDVLVELRRSHGQVLQVFHNLEAGVGNATLILVIRQDLCLSIAIAQGVRPGEDR